MIKTIPEYNFSSILTIHDIQRKICRRIVKDGDSDCFIWTGAPSIKGYGRIAINGKDLKVHRLVASLAYGRVPAGMVIDHLCRNRLCVNPKHLEIVTNKINLSRSDLVGKSRSEGNPWSRLRAGELCMAQRHALNDGDIVRRTNGKRIVSRCKPCQYERDREWRRRKKLALAGSI